MDKIQITKIALQPKIVLVKKEKLNGPNFQEKKKGPKIESKQLKTIWPKLNTVIACPLCSLASSSHISLISTSNCNPFEAIDSWVELSIIVFSGSLLNLASISYISLVSSLNCNLFEALESWLHKLQCHRWFVLRNS